MSTASKLLREHDLFKLPVNVEALAKSLNISVTYSALEDDVSGFLLIKNSKANVFINALHHVNRQRFTLAHEIGHYVLHHQKRNQPKSEDLFLDRSFQLYSRADRAPANTQVAKMEREANQFAADLLMPKDLLVNCIAQQRLDVDEEIAVYLLALTAGVSERAMEIQLQKFELASA